MSKPLLLVVWIDAIHPDGAWQDEDEAECAVEEIVSVGFLIAQNDLGMTLAGTRAKGGHYTQEFHVPFGCVVSIEQLSTSGTKLVPEPKAKARR